MTLPLDNRESQDFGRRILLGHGGVPLVVPEHDKFRLSQDRHTFHAHLPDHRTLRQYSAAFQPCENYGRTAVLGDTYRLSARPSPAGRPSAGVDRDQSVSLCCVGALSCRESYRSASRAPRKCTDTSVGHRQKCRSIISGLLPSSCGRSRPQPFSLASPSVMSAPQSDGSPENSSRRQSSSPRSSSKSQDGTKRRRHRWGDAQRFEHPDRPDISKTERPCIHPGCNIVRVTRHESNEHWIEFWKDGERIECDATPPCVPA